MKYGWGCFSLGDRLAYDLVFDVEGTLVKIQVKSAWFDGPSGNYRITVEQKRIVE
jgi:hypothetical protein